MTFSEQIKSCDNCGLPRRVGSCTDSDGRMCYEMHLHETYYSKELLELTDLKRKRTAILRQARELNATITRLSEELDRKIAKGRDR